jgi:hypothetical protein
MTNPPEQGDRMLHMYYHQQRYSVLFMHLIVNWAYRVTVNLYEIITSIAIIQLIYKRLDIPKSSTSKVTLRPNNSSLCRCQTLSLVPQHSALEIGRQISSRLKVGVLLLTRIFPLGFFGIASTNVTPPSSHLYLILLSATYYQGGSARSNYAAASHPYLYNFFAHRVLALSTLLCHLGQYNERQRNLSRVFIREPNNPCIIDERMVKQESFNFSRSYLEPPHFKDFFQTINNKDVSVLVDNNLVSGVHPTVDKRFFSPATKEKEDED